jgi:hypothetical protein
MPSARPEISAHGVVDLRLVQRGLLAVSVQNRTVSTLSGRSGAIAGSVLRRRSMNGSGHRRSFSAASASPIALDRDGEGLRWKLVRVPSSPGTR